MISTLAFDRFICNEIALRGALHFYKKTVYNLPNRPLTSATPEAVLDWLANAIEPPTDWDEKMNETLHMLFQSRNKPYEVTKTEILLTSAYYLLLLPIGTVAPNASFDFNHHQQMFRALCYRSEYDDRAFGLHQVGMFLAVKMGGDMNRVRMSRDMFGRERVQQAILYASLSLGSATNLFYLLSTLSIDIGRWGDFITSLKDSEGGPFIHIAEEMKTNKKTAEDQIADWIPGPPPSDKVKPDISAMLIAEASIVQTNLASEKEPPPSTPWQSSPSPTPFRNPLPWLPLATAEHDFSTKIAMDPSSSKIPVDVGRQPQSPNLDEFTPFPIAAYCVTPLASFHTAPSSPSTPWSPDSDFSTPSDSSSAEMSFGGLLVQFDSPEITMTDLERVDKKWNVVDAEDMADMIVSVVDKNVVIE